MFEHEESTTPSESTLISYCNWALHNQLKDSTAENILSLLSPINEFYSLHSVVEDLPEELVKIVWSTISLDELKDSLHAFLKATYLPDDIVTNTLKWHKFLRAYLIIIEDCPLKLRSDNTTSSLEQIIINILENKPQNYPNEVGEYLLSIHWKFVGHNGEIGTLNNHLFVPKLFST